MKVRLWSLVLAPVLAALVLAGCATTQDQASKEDLHALCSALDTNHDGKITKEEFMARANDKNKALEVYQNCDTGNKGFLTYNDINYNRVMIPPELYMTPPPVLMPRR